MSPQLEIQIQTLKPRWYVGVRRVVKAHAIPEAYADILPRAAQWLAERGITPEGPPILVYHSMLQETAEFDLQPGFFVAEAVEGDGDIGCAQTAGGEVLVAMHVGPYPLLGRTWEAVFARAKELGRDVTHSSWEVYIDDPGKVDEENLRTQIFVPLDAA